MSHLREFTRFTLSKRKIFLQNINIHDEPNIVEVYIDRFLREKLLCILCTPGYFCLTEYIPSTWRMELCVVNINEAQIPYSTNTNTYYIM